MKLTSQKMKIATDYLNRPFRLSGKVIEGEKIGRTINFPTANLHIEETYKLMPCDGVYFIQSQLENRLVYGMMNVGFRPTLEGEKRSFEVHFFDFKQDLYGALLHIDLLELIRKEKKFDSLEMLKAQLEEDQAKCRQLIPAK